MAIRCSSIPVMILKIDARQLPARAQLSNNGQSSKRGQPVRIQPYPVNKLVFEDKSTGVACYKDETGELICEGYDDERPWYPESPSPRVYNQRNRERELPTYTPERQFRLTHQASRVLVPNGIALKELDQQNFL